jgi:hypothetical protein
MKSKSWGVASAWAAGNWITKAVASAIDIIRKKNFVVRIWVSPFAVPMWDSHLMVIFVMFQKLKRRLIRSLALASPPFPGD